MKWLLVSVCVLLAACSGGEDEATKARPSEAPAPEPACPNQEAVVSDVSLRTGEPRTGDVDGDGEDESVSIYFDPQGAPGCQAFVVADSEGGTLAGALETWREEYGLPMPTLNSFADVDGSAGEDVVVNMGAGASTQFVGVVVADGPVLRQVTTDAGRTGQGVPGMFGFGGSVGHLEAVDCAGDGIVVSFAAPDGASYRVERTFFTFTGTELVRQTRDVERVRIQQLDRFPEYAASPFGSCS